MYGFLDTIEDKALHYYLQEKIELPQFRALKATIHAVRNLLTSTQWNAVLQSEILDVFSKKVVTILSKKTV